MVKTSDINVCVSICAAMAMAQLYMQGPVAPLIMRFAYYRDSLINIRKREAWGLDWVQQTLRQSPSVAAPEWPARSVGRNITESNAPGREEREVASVRSWPFDQELLLYQDFFWLMFSRRKIKRIRCDSGSPSNGEIRDCCVHILTETCLTP